MKTTNGISLSELLKQALPTPEERADFNAQMEKVKDTGLEAARKAHPEWQVEDEVLEGFEKYATSNTPTRANPASGKIVYSDD